MTITLQPESRSATPAVDESRLRVTDPAYASLVTDRHGVRLRGTAATAWADVTPRDLTAILATLTATWLPGRPGSDAS